MTNLSESPVMAEILRQYVEQAERSMKLAAQLAGKVLTGEMIASIRAGAVESGTGFIEASVYFDELVRIKDMKVLNYTMMPPLLPMVKYVETVGVDRFPYVPGFKDGRRSESDTINVYRIAEGLRRKFKREPNVRRGYRGIYNEPLRTDVLPRFFVALREHAGAFAMTKVRTFFEER